MLLIKNINVVTMCGTSVIPNQSLLIKDDRIEAIEDTISISEGNVTVIDGKGQYVMPGLINMHTHLGDNPDDLMLYLVNGVTTIRSMWGYSGFRFIDWLMGARVFNHLKLKEQVKKGEVEGPDIYTAGRLLEGEKPMFPRYMYLHALKGQNKIKKVIQGQVEQGYDFIKIYHALSKAQFDTILAVANEYKIPVAGHVPDAVGVRHALESKLHSMEHLYGFINPYHPELNLSNEMISEMAFLAAENKVWNCPTLIANERLANIDKRQVYEQDEQMQYVCARQKKAMRFLHKACAKYYERRGVRGNHTYMEDFYFIVQQLKAQGAGIMLGTDKAVSYVVAGFSEHIEMHMLKEAGLSRYQVLQAATINGAKCLNQEHHVGTVETGKKANLILTQNNPLEDLSTIQTHRGVVKAGKFYSREKCDAVLEKIRKSCA